MITTREMAYAIYGAWRLARFDASGIQFFDNTPEAFWHSFCAALVVLPAYALLVMLDVTGLNTFATPSMKMLVVEAIAYVAGWFAFPLAMVYIARAFDLTAGYFRYIAAYNWAIVLQVTLQLAVAALVVGLNLPAMSVRLALLVALGIILAWRWFIARAVLGASEVGAAGIVAIDLGIEFLIQLYVARILLAGATQG